MAEVDFDEAVALPEAMEAEDGGSVQKGGVQRDALGHKVKGRGAAGAQATMQEGGDCLLYTSPSPRDLSTSRMPSSA